MIIDCHTHTACPEIEQHLAGRTDPARTPYKRDMSAESAATDREQFALLREPFNTVERRLADMKRMRIDAQVIAPAPGQQYYWLDASTLATISRLQNDHVAGLVAQAPQTFRGLGTLPLTDVAASIAEAVRGVEELGLRGFQIDTRAEQRELSDRDFDPLWARLAALGVPLFVHPLGFSEGGRLSPFFMVNTVGQPLEETIAFQHFVFGGVLDRHPALKVLICHGGGYVPFYIGRLDHAWRYRPEVRRLIPEPPSAYLKRFYFDSCVYRPDLVAQLIAMAGADRVLLGSDYPFDMGDPDPLAVLDAVPGLGPADRDAIASGNARALFGLS